MCLTTTRHFASAKVPEDLVAVARKVAVEGTLRARLTMKCSVFTPYLLLARDHLRTLLVLDADKADLMA
jgi:hypothetical protein